MRTPVVLTFSLSIRTGFIRDCRAADSAELRSSGWPLIAWADVTLPASSTLISTITWPEACITFAAEGYEGVVRLIARPFNTPPFTTRFEGVGVPGLVVGLNPGVGLVAGRTSTLGVGDVSSSGVGEGDGLGEGLGVGVGVFRFALTLTLAFTFVFVLKLKLLSIPRFVFSSTLALGRLALTLAFEWDADPRCSRYTMPSPPPSTMTVPITVNKTTNRVFAFFGGA